MTSSASRLSDRDRLIVQAVSRLRQMTASHITRLYFADGSPTSQAIRQRRVCARLVKWGELSRLPRPIGGPNPGSSGSVFLPAGSRTRIPDMHTLDITELFVRTYEAKVEILAFQPEPYCHMNVGHIELKPDAYVKLETPTAYLSYWLELDRGSEFRPQLNKKMRAYANAFDKWAEHTAPNTVTFPKIVFVVHDKLRLDFVEGVMRHQVKPSLFDVVLFDDAVPYLIGD